MLNEVFNDYFAHKENILTRIDARAKIVFVLGAIFAVLISKTFHVSAVIVVLSLTTLLTVKVPLKIIAFRMLCPLGMAVVLLIIQIVFHGREGLSHGFLIMSKIMGCVSLIIVLSLTTPLNLLLKAAAWFRVSKTWIEVAAITYRYVFVLIEDAITIKAAQESRLGYSNISRSLKSLAELAGSVFIRAYDQSIATCQAMQMRGYTGQDKKKKPETLSAHN